jgi:long-chain-fatty-acid--CoA ligase ACSBG
MSAKYTCVPDGYLEPVIGETGVAAWPAKTVPQLFKETCEKFGDRPALAYESNEKFKDRREGLPPGHEPRAPNFQTWTWNKYHEDCRLFAKSMIHFGCKPWEIVNILGFNSPEWLIANNGAMFAAGIAAGIYATNTADACQYITEHSKACILVVENNAQARKYENIDKAKYPNLKAIVVYAEKPDQDLEKHFRERQICSYMHFQNFLHCAEALEDSLVDERIAMVRPGNCSTLIYTSGTTGPPKAVMISHDNVTWTTRNMITHYGDFNHEDRVCSYLPLSHIAAQIVDIHVPMILGACTYFCQPDALKGTLTLTLKDVRPTFFFGVPRVWEKVQEKMLQIGRSITGLKKSISTWAKGCGKEKSVRAQFGGSGGTPFGFGCANAIVLSKAKDALGLNKCKIAFTGAAPLAPDTIWYFSSLDLPIYEVFGQSECTGPHTICAEGEWKVGTCGRPMYGTESRLVPENGEVCYRGRHIFMGYMYMEQQTQDTIDSEGYLHSGDVAEFDRDIKSKANGCLEDMVGESGFMRITGRIKELIITAGGENIPPVLIETEMKGEMMALSNCIVVGDKRKYLTMLVCLKCVPNKETGAPSDDLDVDALFIGEQIGSTAKTLSEASKDPKWAAYIDAGMKNANKRNTSNAQQIQKWKMLPVDLSEKEGDLTPTLKLKRSKVVKKYEAMIDELYGESLTY